MKNKNHFIFLCILIVISLIGIILVYCATSFSGAGVSSDGALYLSTASNLLKGKGLVDLYGHELTLAPPLYPITLALISWITHADVFVIGWLANMIAFGLIIFLSGLLFEIIFPQRFLLAIIGGIVVASSQAMIDTCSSILTDPFFMIFVCLFLLEAARFFKDSKTSHLYWMALLACLASLDRYAGLALTVAGTAFLIIFHRKEIFRGFIRSALFMLSALPLMLWSIFHNYPISGRLFGSYGAANIFGNFYASVIKILYWLIPYSVIKIATPFGLIGIGLLILILINRSPGWKRWFQQVFNGPALIALIFFVVYLGVLVATIDYVETSDLWFERYHIVLLIPLLIMLMTIYEELIPPSLENSRWKIKEGILIALFIVWLLYPISTIRKSEQDDQARGAVRFNNFNFAKITQSDFLKAAKDLSSNQSIYSNYEPAAWFYLRRDILSVPRVDSKSKQYVPDTVTSFQDSVASSKGGYLVWFNTIGYRDTIPTLDQLRQTVKMEPIFVSDIGDIYQISSNAP